MHLRVYVVKQGGVVNFFRLDFGQNATTYLFVRILFGHFPGKYVGEK